MSAEVATAGASSARRPRPGMSVVIPARDAAATLAAQLESLDAQHYDGDWEVIVADNGSVDGTPSIAADWAQRSSRFRVVDASQHPGPNHARNVGAAAARFDRIAFVDADDTVAPGWLAAMAQALECHPCVGGGVQPSGDTGPRRLPAPTEVSLGFLPAPLGANCGCRAEVVHTIGGFDEAFVDGADDVEFFWRAQLAGFGLGYAPHAVVHYRLRSTSAERHRQTRLQCRSQALLFKRFAAHGMPRSSVGVALRCWAKLALGLPRFALGGGRDEEWRHEWNRRWGRLLGSVRHRVVFL